MTNYIPLNRETHADLRCGPTRNHRFAARKTLVPIILDEIALVAREYPIIFTLGDAPLPCALVGMRPETNAYVTAEGAWQADYIPMQIRHYPFALAQVPDTRQEDGSAQFTLCIDMDSEECTDLEGARVFNPAGGLGEEAAKKSELAKTLLDRAGITRAMVRVLEQSGLLVERSIKMKLLDEEPRVVQGFWMVDEDKLNSIPDEEFVALRKKGVMPLIYAHLMSMANLRQGVLAGQVSMDPPSQPAAPAPSSDELDMSLFGDEGDFDLSR